MEESNALRELLRVYSGEKLMDALIASIKSDINEAVTQFESGKNEGAAVSVGRVNTRIDQIEALWGEIKLNS